ncbi:MAG TPA: hypothetical protein VF412_14725 [Bdellovibrio sp.]|uniref:hypothetical protein n=1 Tax=Bdellovibrio sp. TaxID=28201 RepID=UPI002F0FE8C0
MVKQQVKEEKVRVKWSDLLESDMPEFTRGPELSKLASWLHPHYQSYISPVNPIFVSEIPNLEVLNSKKLWAIRDGLVPLLFFFTKFKSPKGLRSKILIEQELLDCVPEVWRPYVGSYYLQAKESSVEVDRAFIYGVNSEVFMSKESISKALDRFTQRKKPWKEIWIYLSTRQFTPLENPRHHTQMFLEIFQRTGAQMNVVDLQEILGVQSWEGWELFELNKKTILADSWLSHAVVSRGGHIADIKQPMNSEIVHLSAHHNCVIQWDVDWPKVKIQDRQENMSELIQSLEARTFNWKKIFSEAKVLKIRKSR